MDSIEFEVSRRIISRTVISVDDFIEQETKAITTTRCDYCLQPIHKGDPIHIITDKDGYVPYHFHGVDCWNRAHVVSGVITPLKEET